MSAVFMRVLLVGLGIGVLAALGALLGHAFGTPWSGSALLASLGAMAVVARDGVRGHRLMEWLRGPQAGAAPRSKGLWGEMGYRVERALRLRERSVEQEQGRLTQFLRAIEASPNGVMLLDQHDQIEWCNALAADHFGLDPERDRQQRVTNLVRVPSFVAYLQRAQFDEPVVFGDGQGKRLFSVLVRTYGEGLKLVLSQDITERERAESMRRVFVANVSHEIRTPLTVLAGFLETMVDLPLSEAERQRVLQLMQQQTNRMQALVSDLLTLAQLEGSPRPTADRWHAVDTLLQRAVSDGQALSGGRHVFSLKGGENTELAGSDTELLSAVGNLVNNAVRYTPDGGHIDVVWRAREGGGATLDVQDDGVGIAREHLGRLTERFYRVDGSRSRETGGTGLGLSIVKHVVQRHGGEIEVHSEPGQGSRFRLVFPAMRLRQSKGAAAAAAGGAAQSLGATQDGR
ncbi:MAG: phosphate regulon sensor histidine kinase PhoR [Rubrivivax sp.]